MSYSKSGTSTKYESQQPLLAGNNAITHNLGLVGLFSCTATILDVDTGSFISYRISGQTPNSLVLTVAQGIPNALISIIG
jgi:hypothetical protein